MGVPLIFASLAEFERDLIRERTRAGLDADRRRGRVGGRKTVLTAAKERQACRMLAEGATNHGNHATVELAQPATRNPRHRIASPTTACSACSVAVTAPTLRDPGLGRDPRAKAPSGVHRLFSTTKRPHPVRLTG